MKVFIAGSRTVSELDFIFLARLDSLRKNHHEVIIGDCYGVDALVQRYFADMKYENVTVYASNGRAKHNLGNWQVKNISVSEKINIKSKDYYRPRDIALAKDADFGLFIWDRKGYTTMTNIENMITLNKEALVYLPDLSKLFLLKDHNDFWQLESMALTSEIEENQVQDDRSLFFPFIISSLAAFVVEHDGVSIGDAVKEIYCSKLYSILEIKDSEIWHYDTPVLYSILKDSSELCADIDTDIEELPQEWAFAVSCIEYFKDKCGISGKRAFDLFEKYGVLDYIADNFNFLESNDPDHAFGKIESFLCERNARF